MLVDVVVVEPNVFLLDQFRDLSNRRTSDHVPVKDVDLEAEISYLDRTLPKNVLSLLYYGLGQVDEMGMLLDVEG